jgi:hypothetical protein
VAIVAMFLGFLATGIWISPPLNRISQQEVILYIDPPPETFRADVSDIACYWVGPTLPDRNPKR